MTRRIYPHGDNRRYVLNRCRCDLCRAAHANEARRRRRAIGYGRWQGLVDATGTVRRIRALNAIGFSCADLARHRGIDRYAVRDLARGKHAKVHAQTARTYAELYDELCTCEGPSSRSVTLARRKAWHGPEAWTDDTIDDPDAQPMVADVVDDVAVQRAVDGDERAIAALNRAERLEAARRLVRRGAGSGAISRHLRMSGHAAAKLVGSVRAGEAA